ncbi:unnamed protein product, partial [Ixodes persulcatus]
RSLWSKGSHSPCKYLKTTQVVKVSYETESTFARVKEKNNKKRHSDTTLIVHYDEEWQHRDGEANVNSRLLLLCGVLKQMFFFLALKEWKLTVQTHDTSFFFFFFSKSVQAKEALTIAPCTEGTVWSLVLTISLCVCLFL